MNKKQLGLDVVSSLSPDFIALGGGGIVALKISVLAVGSELVT